jgi:putative transposase
LKGPRTTVPGTGPDTRPDLVERAFTAERLDQLWVADIIYVRTFAGWVYCAFVLDVFSRRVVGWQVSTSLRTDLAPDALNMGLWTRAHDGDDTTALVHHSDQPSPGVQYLAIRYTERLAEAGAVASVGSKGDSYDNAMAWGHLPLAGEAFNSLFKGDAGSTARLGSSHPSNTRPPTTAPPSPSNLLSGRSNPPSNPVLDRRRVRLGPRTWPG